MERLSKLETVTSAAHAKVHLVISATTRSDDITKIVMRFQRFKRVLQLFPLTGLSKFKKVVHGLRNFDLHLTCHSLDESKARASELTDFLRDNLFCQAWLCE